MPDRRRTVSGLLLLTIVGALLWVPPLVHLFNHHTRILGVPQIVLYLFGVWALLIAGTLILTRRLPPDQLAPTEADEG